MRGSDRTSDKSPLWFFYSYPYNYAKNFTSITLLCVRRYPFLNFLSWSQSKDFSLRSSLRCSTGATCTRTLSSWIQVWWGQIVSFQVWIQLKTHNDECAHARVHMCAYVYIDTIDMKLGVYGCASVKFEFCCKKLLKSDRAWLSKYTFGFCFLFPGTLELFSWNILMSWLAFRAQFIEVATCSQEFNGRIWELHCSDC